MRIRRNRSKTQPINRRTGNARPYINILYIVHYKEFRYPSRIRLAATASTVFFRFLPW